MGASSESCDVEDFGQGWYGGGEFGCEIARPESPHASKHAQQRYGQRRVNAVVKLHCRVPVNAHTVEMALQRKRHGEWRTVLERRDNTRPKADGTPLRLKITYQGCHPGWWRTRAQAFSVYEGRESASPVRWSVPNKIPRRDCKER